MLDSCRLEKAFRHFGHDISNKDHVLEARLRFALSLNKTPSQMRTFIGRDPVLRKKDTGLFRRTV